MKKKVLLCILDGWGIGRKNKNNAIHVAKTKNFDNLTKKYGFIKLDASESEVGLPNGQFGIRSTFLKWSTAPKERH